MHRFENGDLAVWRRDSERNLVRIIKQYPGANGLFFRVEMLHPSFGGRVCSALPSELSPKIAETTDNLVGILVHLADEVKQTRKKVQNLEKEFKQNILDVVW